MLDISEQTLSLIIMVCAIAAINWGLTAYDANKNLVSMLVSDRDIQQVLYYGIALCGVIVIGKKYRWF